MSYLILCYQISSVVLRVFETIRNFTPVNEIKKNPNNAYDLNQYFTILRKQLLETDECVIIIIKW